MALTRKAAQDRRKRSAALQTPPLEAQSVVRTAAAVLGGARPSCVSALNDKTPAVAENGGGQGRPCGAAGLGRDNLDPIISLTWMAGNLPRA